MATKLFESQTIWVNNDSPNSVSDDKNKCVTLNRSAGLKKWGQMEELKEHQP